LNARDVMVTTFFQARKAFKAISVDGRAGRQCPNFLRHKLFVLNDIWLISNHFGNSVSGPEKAGVGDSIPSLATNLFNNLAISKNVQKLHSAYNSRTSVLKWPRTLVPHSPPGAAACWLCADLPTWDSAPSS
jgi:hypothetical protein